MCVKRGLERETNVSFLVQQGQKLLWCGVATPKQAFNYTLESLYKTQVGSRFHHLTSEP